MVVRASSTAGVIEPQGATRKAGPITPDPSWPPQNAAFAAQVNDLINQHRTKIGAGTLGFNVGVALAAVWKGRHMAQYGYMEHDDPAPPVARTCAARIADSGYSGYTWGENIAMGYTTPAAVVDAWLNSPGHKANIENRTYTASGIGVAQAANGYWYWSQDFGVGVDTPPAPPPPGKQTVAQVFDQEFLPALHAMAAYGNWRRDNSKNGEPERFDAFLAHPSATPPPMRTQFGTMLVSAVKMKFLSQ